MSRYILVSIWAEDDGATRLSHAFACQLYERRSATAFVHGDAPPYDALRLAVADAPDAAVVIFAHGGSALSAHRGGAAWISPEGLAAILSGRRVYAFACSTFRPQELLFQDTFASRAVESCIHVFVGHEAPVMTPFAGEASRRRVEQTMEDALVRLIETFVDGEDDKDELVNVGRAYASWDVEIELDLPSDDPDREGAFGWSSVAFLGSFFKSLRVSTKAVVDVVEEPS